MPLNINNYEEYFLLYVDDELSIEDRRLVEEFIFLHPEYKAALEELQQAVVSVDEHIMYEKKNSLFKNSTVTDEDMMLYVDGELTDSELTLFTENINDEVSKKIEEFKLTVSHPDADVVYEKKQYLYKKQSKVFSLNKMYQSVAAVIIIAIGLSIFYNVVPIKKNEDDVTALLDPVVTTDTIIDKALPTVVEEKQRMQVPTIIQENNKQASQKRVPKTHQQVNHEVLYEKAIMGSEPNEAKNLEMREPIFNEDQKIIPQPVTKTSVETIHIIEPINTSKNIAKKEKKSSFFKNIKRTIEDRLADEDGNVSVAGVKVNIKKY